MFICGKSKRIYVKLQRKSFNKFTKLFKEQDHSHFFPTDDILKCV